MMLCSTFVYIHCIFKNRTLDFYSTTHMVGICIVRYMLSLDVGHKFDSVEMNEEMDILLGIEVTCTIGVAYIR